MEGARRRPVAKWKGILAALVGVFALLGGWVWWRWGDEISAYLWMKDLAEQVAEDGRDRKFVGNDFGEIVIVEPILAEGRRFVIPAEVTTRDVSGRVLAYRLAVFLDADEDGARDADEWAWVWDLEDGGSLAPERPFVPQRQPVDGDVAWEAPLRFELVLEIEDFARVSMEERIQMLDLRAR